MITGAEPRGKGGVNRPPITISRAGRRDFRQIRKLADLEEEIFKCSRPGRTEELLSAISHPETSALYTAFCGWQMCGFVLVRFSKRRSEWIVRGIGVDGGYRRKGIGTALLTEAVRFVNGEMRQRLVSYVGRKNASSLRIHEKAGFHLDRKSPLPMPELSFRMVSLP